MSTVLHSLLSCTGIFKGDCEERHLISNSKGNGYLTLYQIVHMTHPVLGQTTAQPVHPLHTTKTQPFSEHVAHYLDYFQSEECSGCLYSLNERIVLIISRLHPDWRTTMKKKYTNIILQNGVIPSIPLECHLDMLIATLIQWYAVDHLDSPSSRGDHPLAPAGVFIERVTRSITPRINSCMIIVGLHI
jgi:hypothetical protein